MKKIEYAVGAAGSFIYHMHREGFDRGMIATFSDGFRIEQDFTGNEVALHRSLGRVANHTGNGSTRLYDSLEDVITRFWQAGYRDRPWLLTVITDGQDNASHKYKGNPWSIGQYIGTHFNHEPSNFTFLIGVGGGQQIDRQALGTLGDSGHFPAMTIGAFPLLEALFLQIAMQVSTQLVGRQLTVGHLTWAEVARIRAVSHTAFDYAFLLDQSGSMAEAG